MLSDVEIAELEKLNSLFFGDNEVKKEESGIKQLLTKGIAYYTKFASDTDDKKTLASSLCRLGHYHLLICDYHKALSAYNRYSVLEEDHWKNSEFLYGMGILHYHFGAFSLAINYFQQLLYNEPSFSKAGEVHCRLGLIFKIIPNYEAAIKHFKLALSDKRNCTVSKCQMKFHVGHLYEMQSKFPEAKLEYESVLELPAEQLSKTVQADTLRQLGWIYHTSDALTRNSPKALDLLQRSIEIDPNNGQTWYLLGRYHSNMGKVHDAFVSYRQSIDKSEANADTWCSIGVLYQEQNQPMDALQAYICAVQLDRSHEAAWRDLAILYEACQQPKDALVCYINAQKCKQEKHGDQDVEVNDRIKALEQIVRAIDLNGQHNQGKILPSIEEAWTLPIPAELSQRQSAFKCAPNNSNDAQSDVAVNADRCQDSAPSQKRTVSSDDTQSWHLNNQQLQVMHNLQLNKPILMPSQMMELERLEHTYTLMMEERKKAKEDTDGKTSASTGEETQRALPPISEIRTKRPCDMETESSIAEIEKQWYTDSEIPNRPLPPLLCSCGISETMPARDVITTCRKHFAQPSISDRLYLGTCPPPKRPPPPSTPLSKDKLCPATPTIYLESKRDAMSKALANFCSHPSNPVTVIRGLASALKLDLGLFSTKTLAECNGDCQVEVRTQFRQTSDENWDATGQKRVWKCESSRSFTTIDKYAEYQAATFQDSLRQEGKKHPTSQVNELSKDSLGPDKSADPRVTKRNCKIIKFGTNIDLSSETKWKDQLIELAKLPWLFRLVSAGNMLSHVGQTILGMNTIQLYMKVPGSRTPGHQENNNFCALNINIGPGDCEWFATPEEYWGVIAELCEKHNIDYLSGSWWPVLEDLYNENVPVYRFVQKPGDLVWLNAGTVHWVQALGWCNNIAWNVGLISAYQYQMAVERYEYNKLTQYKSIVPLIQLTWYLAQHVRISDPKLFKLLKTLMMRTLWYCQKSLDNLKANDIQLVWHGRHETDTANHCEHCEVEVFNLLFARLVEGTTSHVVFCENCARKESSDLAGFVVLAQYHMDDLMRIYDEFTLAHKKSKR